VVTTVCSRCRDHSASGDAADDDAIIGAYMSKHKQTTVAELLTAAAECDAALPNTKQASPSSTSTSSATLRSPPSSPSMSRRAKSPPSSPSMSRRTKSPPSSPTIARREAKPLGLNIDVASGVDLVVAYRSGTQALRVQVRLPVACGVCVMMPIKIGQQYADTIGSLLPRMAALFNIEDEKGACDVAHDRVDVIAIASC
jgi:hypothetical protein